MSSRYARSGRRAGATALLVASLVLTATGCGGGEGTQGGEDRPAGNTAPAANQGATSDEGKTLPDTSKVLVTLKNDKGIEMIVREVKRDTGGFVTVSGEFKNPTSEAYTTPVQWNGPEKDVAAQGNSVAAMTLVDSKEKKRYYVLRDTDNRPLTTVGYDPSIQAGKSLIFFAQFPAPPTTTTTVDLQFVGFPNTPIEIS